MFKTIYITHRPRKNGTPRINERLSHVGRKSVKLENWLTTREAKDLALCIDFFLFICKVEMF